MPRKTEEWKQRAELPWRQKPPQKEPLKMRVTKDQGSESTMYLPATTQKQNPRDRLRERARRRHEEEHDGFGADPRLKIAFSKNFRFLKRVFSADTILMPLPPDLRRNAARNLGFFTRIFTQFFDPKGIQDAQKSIGLGREERIRHVR